MTAYNLDHLRVVPASRGGDLEEDRRPRCAYCGRGYTYHDAASRSCWSCGAPVGASREVEVEEDVVEYRGDGGLIARFVGGRRVL